MPKYQIADYIGKRYNHLIVIGKSSNSKKPNAFDFKCDCGNITLVLPYPLRTGGVKSCGCLKIKSSKNFGSMQPLSKGNLKDGRSKHPLYGTWQRMIDRCENPNTNHYDRYGGRGIKVCDEWHNFWKFVEWSDSVGGRPKGFTLDRIDNDGNYEPSNCRWTDWNTQTSNKSSNRFIEFNGKKQTIHQWALELGINEETLRNRINRGWSVEKALTAKSYIGNNQYTSKK